MTYIWVAYHKIQKDISPVVFQEEPKDINKNHWDVRVYILKAEYDNVLKNLGGPKIAESKGGSSV